MSEEYQKLKAKYKTHTKVAELLGMTPRHYVRIRRGEVKPKKSLRYMIRHLLVDLSE